MLQFASRPEIRRNAFRHRRRFQLGGGLLIAVVLPWLIYFCLVYVQFFPPLPLDAGLIRHSLVANAFATITGFLLFRSLTVYPGIRASYYILPTYSAAYGLAIAGLFMTRLEYNRFIVVAGYVLCISWYYIVFFLNQRESYLRIGVIPFGQVDYLREVDRIEWIYLNAPSAKDAYACDALVADFRANIPNEWERFLADMALDGITVYHVKQLRESLTGRVEIDHLSENNFGSLIPARVYVKAKFLADFVAALFAAILGFPFLLLIGLAVRLDSEGPALFRQQRIGYGGRPFIVYKFRTMRHVDTSDPMDRRQAITGGNDPRVTRLGRLLRYSRIDELPQIINILRGEMSWIGPRPEAAILSSWYEQELPFYRYRHVVRPGITGWAQINQGHVAEVDDVLWKLQYDFYYIKNFSAWLDVLILFRTLRTVLTGFGSR